MIWAQRYYKIVSGCMLQIFFALIVCLGQAKASTTTIYQTGFESPNFHTGRLSGQGGWTSEWHSEGQEFEPPWLHHLYKRFTSIRVS